MSVISAELLRPIFAGYELEPNGIHGLAHWARVREIGLRLAAETGADVRVIELFSIFHDARRWNNGRDPEHGSRGAELARELRGSVLDLPDPEFDLLTYACEHHTEGHTEGDVTVRTCWDSDRLDLGRAGITPKPARLCTAAARDPEIIAWADQRSCASFEPTIVATKWQRMVGD